MKKESLLKLGLLAGVKGERKLLTSFASPFVIATYLLFLFCYLFCIVILWGRAAGRAGRTRNRVHLHSVANFDSTTCFLAGPSGALAFFIRE